MPELQRARSITFKFASNTSKTAVNKINEYQKTAITVSIMALCALCYSNLFTPTSCTPGILGSVAKKLGPDRTTNAFRMAYAMGYMKGWLVNHSPSLLGSIVEKVCSNGAVHCAYEKITENSWTASLAYGAGYLKGLIR